MAVSDQSTDDVFESVATALDALVHVRVGGAIVWVNDAFARTTGLSAGAAIPADDGLASAVAALSASGEKVSPRVTHRMPCASGGVRLVESVARRGRWRGNDAFVIVSTERRDDAASIGGDDDRRLRLMVENFNDILLIMDREGIERFVSPSCERILGFRPDELLGVHGLTYVHPDDHASIRDGLGAAIRGARPNVVLEFRHQHKGGGWRWLEAVGSSLLDDPSVAGVMLVARDVTARRTAEEERVRLEAHLRHAQKMESVGRLAGGIAHDFNNLLTAIRGNLSVALEELPAADPLREAVEDADRAADSAAHLTRQLLGFSRRQMIAPRVLDLGEVIGQMEKMLRRTLGEPIALSSSIASDLWRVKLDPGQVEQILVNLALNARDAMPSGGALSISATNRTLSVGDAAARNVAPGDYVEIEISDTGTGISEEARPHVFEPFFTTKEVGKGTGLGLATVYGVVKQNGGHIDLAPAHGTGATFVIHLPRTTEDARAGEPGRGVVGKGREVIVIVEDDERVRAMVVRLLGRVGYRVMAFASGEAALSGLAMHAGPIDLLLSDVIMPGMNGRTLADRMRESHPGLKVLFTSGYTADVIAEHGVLAPAVHLLEKPYTFDALALRVRTVLDTP